MTSLILEMSIKDANLLLGPKISSNAFGKERRYPMTSKFQTLRLNLLEKL